MTRGYLGGEILCEKLTSKKFDYDRPLRVWGINCYIHQKESSVKKERKFTLPQRNIGRAQLFVNFATCLSHTRLVKKCRVTFDQEQKGFGSHGGDGRAEPQRRRGWI